MADKKDKEAKTPMQQAEAKIKTAYIAAFISAVLTFAFAIASLFADLYGLVSIFSIIDVIFVFILAVLLVTIKSRIAAVILLVYSREAVSKMRKAYLSHFANAAE